MIAACPKCSARYRIDREKLGDGGVRLRCSRCESVFRVRAPQIVSERLRMLWPDLTDIIEDLDDTYPGVSGT